MEVNANNEVKAVVRNFINGSVNIDSLGDDENLFEKGLVNSLFAVQLMTFIERKFGVEIGMEDLDIKNFSSITATAEFIAKKSGNRAL
jgi:acyl carrier protein